MTVGRLDCMYFSGAITQLIFQLTQTESTRLPDNDDVDSSNRETHQGNCVLPDLNAAA